MNVSSTPLADRVIFITGAASGIGKSTVAACRAAGSCAASPRAARTVSF
jgi:NAD(P)-dependent dehydrogenase (short-subunit alcohol dehydrogenase family)